MKYLLTNQSSERLDFRLLEPSDFDTWTSLFDRPQVAAYLGLDPKLSAKELCQIWFDKVFHRYAHDLGGMNALMDRKSGQLVGQSGLLIQSVEDENRLEVGYSILPSFQNLGFATEAAKKCRDFAFERGFSDHLISIINVGNVKSEKVARKNGMRFEMQIKSHESADDSVNIFRLDAADWKAFP